MPDTQGIRHHAKHLHHLLAPEGPNNSLHSTHSAIKNQQILSKLSKDTKQQRKSPLSSSSEQQWSKLLVYTRRMRSELRKRFLLRFTLVFFFFFPTGKCQSLVENWGRALAPKVLQVCTGTHAHSGVTLF